MWHLAPFSFIPHQSPPCSSGLLSVEPSSLYLSFPMPTLQEDFKGAVSNSKGFRYQPAKPEAKGFMQQVALALVIR